MSKPKGRGYHWYSVRRKRPEPIKHAPAVIGGKTNSSHAYCKEFAVASRNIAKPGDTVDCKCCLRALKKKPQYANYLMARGIECRGTIWTDGRGNEQPARKAS